MLVQALIFMHRRGGFALCAQARWFCKTVQNHRACARKSLVCKIVKNLRANAKSTQESAHLSHGLAVIFTLRAPPAAEGQKRLLEPFSNTFFGHLPDPSRTPPGRLPGPSRTAPGPLPDTSRAPPGHLPDTVCALRCRLYAQPIRLRMIRCVIGATSRGVK